MDAFLVKRIAAELSAGLHGALVSKVHQPAEREIVLTLWTGRGEKRLLVSAHPELCRIHLTTRRAPNPPSPPRFCQFLRRHLEGMRLEGISAAPFDRLVRADFVSSRPDALHERSALYAELYGRHANLVYVGPDGVILEPLRAVSPEESRIREVAAGIPYRPLPRPERIFLPDVTPADADRIVAMAWEGLPKVLQREISGLGRELAREAAARAEGSGPGLYAALRDLVRRYEADELTPGIGTLPSGKKRILPFPCDAAGFSAFVPFPTANEAADAYYGEVAAAQEIAVLRQQLRSRLAALLKKERHKLENVGGDAERLEEGLKGGGFGETLKANLAALSRGMTEFEGIPLDPRKTPVENMNRYFRLFKKAKGATEIVRTRRREVTESVYYLESLEIQAAAAATREELLAVRQELSASYAPGAPGHRRKRRPDVPKPVAPQVERLEYAGFAILVGKNNVGNDRIVRELADPGDLWLHAQGIPGSHVLVKRPPGKVVPDEVVGEAARLAVLHSKAKGAANVPVFLAEARHVSKFKGAKPGLVRIARYRTINVR
ncbi:MAG: NFACT family protein [Gemmatimonadota bacterium]